MNKISLLFLFSFLNMFAVENSYSSLGDTVFYDNFENGLNDWAAYNLSNPPSSSLWRLTNVKYVSPSYCVGWYDSLTNSYPNLSYEALVSPSIVVPSNALVTLNFDLFIHLGPNGSTSNDKFDIQITTNNGNTWTYFSQYGYSGQQIGWKNFPSDYSPGETGDLTSYAGKTIQIRFLISSDNSAPNGEGVFIDNFRIVKSDCGFTDIFEPNNFIEQATSIIPGQNNINAVLCPVGDLDYFSFPVTQNDKISVIVNHNVFQLTLTLINPNGVNVLSTGNKQLTYSAPIAGIYKLKVSLSEIFTSTPNYNLYVNVINTKPDMISVTDIPGDQGLKVQVKWQYSLFDPPDSVSAIKAYHLFRKVNDTTSLNRLTIIDDAELTRSSDLKDKIIHVETEYWDFVATIPAISPRPFTNYTFTAPTLKDSVESIFRVAAVNKTASQPVLWGSEKAGVSYDNIAPVFDNYSVTPGNNGINIRWDVNQTIYTDVKEIKIYKGMFNRFAPLSSNIVATLNPALSVYNDLEIFPGETYFYILAITDLAGNASYTAPVSGTVTSVYDDKNTPYNFNLKQNYPNPFNPVTIIEFSVAKRQEVLLKVYDILGREIRILTKGNFLPGNYKISFDAGNLPSGIYFYTLTAGEFSNTKKLTLIK